MHKAQWLLLFQDYLLYPCLLLDLIELLGSSMINLIWLFCQLQQQRLNKQNKQQCSQQNYCQITTKPTQNITRFLGLSFINPAALSNSQTAAVREPLQPGLNFCTRLLLYFYLGESQLLNYNKSMQNRPPLIRNPSDLGYLPQKYKFWDTSLAGTQLSPTDTSLVAASEPHHDNNLHIPLQQSGDGIQGTLEDGFEEGEDTGRAFREERIRVLEEELQALRLRIEENRVLNQNLVKQLNKTTNQLRASQKLNEELNSQCDKLYTSVKLAHEKHSEVQNEKMDLLIQISSLNQQKQLALSKTEILEESIEYLNKKIQTLHEENSFEKMMANDLKKQIVTLKEQLNKMISVMQDYSNLQQQVSKSHSVNQQIKKKVKVLEEELKNTRLKVEQSQMNQQQYRQEQNKLFTRIEELENVEKILQQKLNVAHDEIKLRDRQRNNLQTVTEYENKYVKILEEYERRNQDLIFELMAVNERNHKLLEERDYYMRRVQASQNNRNQRLPYDQFVYMLKNKDAQTQAYKRLVEQKEDEVQAVRIQFAQEISILKQKISELNNKVQIKQKQLSNKELLLNNEVQIYKKQSDIMNRRNEDLKGTQMKLRLEIMQKDKIIMGFIERSKAEPQSKGSQKRLNTSTA